MKTVKTKIGVIALGFILGLALYINPVYALDFDKEEMDIALREELSKIPDPVMREAILEEYKEIVIENMPELDIEEATCQECEEDLEALEKGKVTTVMINKEEFSNRQDTITESDTKEVTSSAVESVEVIRVEPDADPVETDPVETDPIIEDIGPEVEDVVLPEVEIELVWATPDCGCGGPKEFEAGTVPNGWTEQ